MNQQSLNQVSINSLRNNCYNNNKDIHSIFVEASKYIVINNTEDTCTVYSR